MPADAVLVDLDMPHNGRGPSWTPGVIYRFKMARERLRAAGYQVKSMIAKPSRKHVHLIIRVDPKPRTLIERIALQLLCGSDVDREANNLRRAKTLRRMPAWARRTANVLYEKSN